MKYLQFKNKFYKRIFRVKLIILTVSFFTAALMLLFCFSSSVAAEDFWQNQLEEARKEFEDSGSLVSRYRLAISRANTGELIETLEMIDEFDEEFDISKLEEEIAFELRLAELGSENILYLNYAAFYYSIKENYEKAVEYFDKINSLDSDNIWPYNYKAVILIEEMENYEKALQVLDRALEVEENDYSYLLRGLAHYRMGNYLRAANSLRRGRSSLDEIEENF